MPVIVNAILNEHQIVVDIVAFVGRGDFPRSRLGEKQRGKILAGWVSRKMRTIAQFSIRGGDLGLQGAGAAPPLPPGTSSSDSPGVGGADAPLAYEGGGLNRGSLGSFRSSGVAGASSSLRNVEHAPQILEQRELEQQMEGMAALGGGGTTGGGAYGYQGGQGGHPQALDTPLAEMPADEAVARRPRTGDDDDDDAGGRDGVTPTKARHERQRSRGSYEVPDYGGFGGGDDGEGRQPPNPGPKPGSSRDSGGFGGVQSPTMRLPGVDGRESLSFDDWPAPVDNRNSLPSRQGHQGQGEHQGGGSSNEAEDEDDEWAKDAGMYMNLAGTLGRRDV